MCLYIYIYIHIYIYIYLESASEYRPVFFERNKRFSVSFMTLRNFGLSLIKNQTQWQSLLQIYKHAEC